MYNRASCTRSLAGAILLVGFLASNILEAADVAKTSADSAKTSAKPGGMSHGKKVQKRKPGAARSTGKPVQAELQSSDVSLETSSATGSEVAMLKEQLSQQQKQIEELRGALEEQKQLLTRALQTLPTAAAQAPSASLVAGTSPIIPLEDAKAKTLSEAFPLPKKPGPTVNSPDLAPSSAVTQNPAESKGEAEGKKSPLTLHIGDAEFTIGGFADATAFFRSTNLGSGIGTSFGAAPFSNTTAGRLTETRFSAQNSRVTLMATSNVGANNVRGYIEADFLGLQPANGFVTSNSNSLRMRLYWVQLIRDKFEFLGGQSWSMLNPNRQGLSPVPSDIFYSQNMDTNYQVGLTWSRQQQFRFIYYPSKTWAMGVSLENPEQYVTAAVKLPGASCSATPPGPFCSQLDIAGAGGSTATPNLHPDIIGKVAYDPEVAGKHMHVEVAGLLRSFKVFNPSANSTATATGGGGSVNFNLEAVKNLHLILNSFYSDGGGRYIFGLGPDLIIKPNGTPSPVHSGSGIGGFEYQFNPQTMVYAYYGGAYYQRNTAIDPATGKFLGFGFPGSSSSSNKSVQEGTFGIIQTFWKNPRYGALQLITQYSYLTRFPWSVAAGNPKDAHLSMGYVNVRYVLP